MATSADSNFRNLEHRAVLPSHESLRFPEHCSIWDKVQGDVFMLFPKIAENFVFFRIKDEEKFRAALRNYKPTSSREVADRLGAISHFKGSTGNVVNDVPRDSTEDEDANEEDETTDEEDSTKDDARCLPVIFHQIAFTRPGLQLLLRNDGKLEDWTFDNVSMLQDRDRLGDQSPYYRPFINDNLHGVFTVAGCPKRDVRRATKRLMSQFSDSIDEETTTVLKGRRRPRPFRNHEHFGYKDGVSQPALRGLVQPNKGQLEADRGVIIMGYEGDPVYDQHLANPNAPKRPWWTKNGSLMVFRNLEQDVFGFEAFLNERAPYWEEHTPVSTEVQPPFKNDQEKADFIGATIVGRWKSGAPIALAHFRDDPVIAGDRNKVNDFDYTVLGHNMPTARYCPFTAHLRKTAPRNLDPFLSRKFLESALIMRGGIPYGPEIRREEREAGESLKKRGLFFISYQSSLDNGFVRQTVDFAGNDYFPNVSLQTKGHGQDSILGNPATSGLPVQLDDEHPTPHGQTTLQIRRNDETVAEVSGWSDPAWRVTAKRMKFFVTSRGGEYFFVPPIDVVHQIANGWLEGFPE